MEAGLLICAELHERNTAAQQNCTDLPLMISDLHEPKLPK
jgi:hypothetical protein